jgi:uracil phosphoribosyltransferase
MQKPKKVNVSINPETMELLTKLRETLTEEMGFTPSYSQVIQYLVKERENAKNSVRV